MNFLWRVLTAALPLLQGKVISAEGASPKSRRGRRSMVVSDDEDG